jgi:hypothetical protein
MELDAVLTKELVEGGFGAAGSQAAAGGNAKHVIADHATPAVGTGQSNGVQGTNPMVMSLRSFLNEDIPYFPFMTSASDDKSRLLSV